MCCCKHSPLPQLGKDLREAASLSTPALCALSWGKGRLPTAGPSQLVLTKIWTSWKPGNGQEQEEGVPSQGDLENGGLNGGQTFFFSLFGPQDSSKPHWHWDYPEANPMVKWCLSLNVFLPQA